MKKILLSVLAAATLMALSTAPSSAWPCYRHHHHWQINGREKIYRHSQPGVDTDHRKSQTDHHNEVRVANGKARHGALVLFPGIVVLRQVDHLGLDCLACFQAAPIAHDNRIAFL